MVPVFIHVSSSELSQIWKSSYETYDDNSQCLAELFTEHDGSRRNDNKSATNILVLRYMSLQTC